MGATAVMSESVLLHGYRYSVYNRIARVALHEKDVEYDTEEVDPFADDIPEDYLKRHPFGRVPVLSHGAFDVYETSAIVQYVDAAFDGPSLVPISAKPLARAAQVISILDSYGYRSMVRQVFAHRVFRPAIGEAGDETEITSGMETSMTVLRALNKIAEEGYVLNEERTTIADCHLAPMIAYFVQAPEGQDALGSYPALARWWSRVEPRESLRTTNPGLPNA